MSNIHVAVQHSPEDKPKQPWLSKFTPPRVWTTNVSRANGMKLIRGEKWAADPSPHKISYKVRGQPFIMKSGHTSGSVYFTWRCTPYQWLATKIRAVIERIRARDVVWRRSRRKNRHHCTMIAILYSLTDDDYMLERLLNCQAKGFTRTFYHYLHSVDIKTRFLYDQALNGALWFELRGRPRVQSTKLTLVEQYRNFGTRNYDSVRLRREEASAISNQWLVNRQGFTKGMAFVNSPWGC